jgi:hypothetical protein
MLKKFFEKKEPKKISLLDKIIMAAMAAMMIHHLFVTYILD